MVTIQQSHYVAVIPFYVKSDKVIYNNKIPYKNRLIKPINTKYGYTLTLFGNQYVQKKVSIQDLVGMGTNAENKYQDLYKTNSIVFIEITKNNITYKYYNNGQLINTVTNNDDDIRKNIKEIISSNQDKIDNNQENQNNNIVNNTNLLMNSHIQYSILSNTRLGYYVVFYSSAPISQVEGLLSNISGVRVLSIDDSNENKISYKCLYSGRSIENLKSNLISMNIR